MRDLFQVVFELKKKEIELAKQHIEQNAINAIKFHTGGMFVEPAPDTKVSRDIYIGVFVFFFFLPKYISRRKQFIWTFSHDTEFVQLLSGFDRY